MTYIAFLMQIPGVSEVKAISVAKVFPTFRKLMEFLEDKQLTDKDKQKHLADIEVETNLGEKNKKLGKKLAEKIFLIFLAADPSIVI